MLGRHVRGCPENQPHRRHGRSGRRARERRRLRKIHCARWTCVRELRQPEVEHLYRSVFPHFDIGGLEIAMDDPELVRRAERRSDLPRNRQRLVEREGALADSVGKGGPLDELHHERLHAIGIFESVDRCAVRVIERSQDFRLALETGEPVWICRHSGRQDLDRDLTLQARVGRAVHLAHPAGAKRRDDAVRSQVGSFGQGHPWSIP